MALHNSSSSNTFITLVDNREQLPFQLKIINGIRKSEKEITVDKLTQVRSSLHNFIYPITELSDLAIKCVSEQDISIKLYWDKIYYGKDFDKGAPFDIVNGARITLYENSKNKPYPWRIGMYHFEVLYEGNSYYGAFKVCPKNLDNNQLSHIYDLLNKEIEDLVIDHFHFKLPYEKHEDIKARNYWHFFNWYKEKQPILLHAIHLVEVESQREIKKEYRLEVTEKLPDAKTIRFNNSPKGLSIKNTKYLNRKLISTHNIEANQLIKHRILSLLEFFKEAINMASEHINEQELSISELKNNLSALQVKSNHLNQNLVSYKKSKDVIANTILAKETELEQYLKKKKDIVKIQDTLIKQSRTLQIKMMNSFWQKVHRKIPKRYILGRGSGYKLIEDIWNHSQALFTIQKPSQSKTISPVYRPTHEIYEYYVYLCIIKTFQKIGFSLQNSLRNQIKTTFYQEGIKDGTIITLIKDNTKINLVYNEYIEPHSSLARKHSTYFYANNVDKRKPDIRIDCYKISENDWRYNSSIIVEVKYSPLRNIYDEFGATEAMYQMTSYFTFKYAYPSPGEYEHNPIENVICAFPGDESCQQIDFSTDSGTFLQFYPKKDSNDLADFVGKESLKRILNKWFEKVNK